MIKKKIILIYFLLSFFSVQAAENNKYFKQGVELFKNNKLDEAKISFEKDIVRNTKNKESYLYLSKIYKKKNNLNEFEKNLNTVLLLDPKNEEALYLFILKEIKDADYENAVVRFELFKKSCQKICDKQKEINQLLKKNKT